jgi:uncharacterized RDD family membrane protein YckC
MTAPTRRQVTGHYAGAVSRAAGTILDLGAMFASFTVLLAGLDFLARIVIGETIAGERGGPAWVIALVVWGFLYMFLGLAIAGRTPGKWVVGLRVVMKDGSTLTISAAFWRTILLPVSAAPLGVGFLGILFHREHRALHDLVAGTAVVYDWGRRIAELPGPLSEFLARRAGEEFVVPAPNRDAVD